MSSGLKAAQTHCTAVNLPHLYLNIIHLYIKRLNSQFFLEVLDISATSVPPQTSGFAQQTLIPLRSVNMRHRMNLKKSNGSVFVVLLL